MAAFHADVLEQGKSGCQCDPTLKKMWGCTEPAQNAVWVTPDDEDIFECPVKLIPENIVEWYAEYAYYKDFSGSAPPYQSLPAKWLESMRVYNKYYFDFYSESSKPKGDSTSSLKSTVMQRKQKAINNG